MMTTFVSDESYVTVLFVAADGFTVIDGLICSSSYSVYDVFSEVIDETGTTTVTVQLLVRTVPSESVDSQTISVVPAATAVTVPLLNVATPLSPDFHEILEAVIPSGISITEAVSLCVLPFAKVMAVSLISMAVFRRARCSALISDAAFSSASSVAVAKSRYAGFPMFHPSGWVHDKTAAGCWAGSRFILGAYAEFLFFRVIVLFEHGMWNYNKQDLPPTHSHAVYNLRLVFSAISAYNK